MHGPTCIFWANLSPFSLQRHEGPDAVNRLQRRLDRTMRILDDKEISGIVTAMDDKAAAALDQDDTGTISAAELHTFVELAASIDTDNDGHVSEAEDAKWHTLIQANTVWVGNGAPQAGGQGGL